MPILKTLGYFLHLPSLLALPIRFGSVVNSRAIPPYPASLRVGTPAILLKFSFDPHRLETVNDISQGQTLTTMQLTQ